MEKPSELVLFDLDHTLLTGDSDSAWTDFLIEQGVLEEDARKQSEIFYRQYLDGKLDMDAYLKFKLQPLTRYPKHLLDTWRESFMQERIMPMVTPAAMTLVASAEMRGALVAVVTSTNYYITELIPALFGIAHLVATRLKLADDRFTGEIDGPICYQEGKIVCTEHWLKGLGYSWEDFAEITCYSDSHNDLPLLRKATRAIVVNPDKILANEAFEKDWEMFYIQTPN